MLVLRLAARCLSHHRAPNYWSVPNGWDHNTFEHLLKNNLRRSTPSNFQISTPGKIYRYNEFRCRMYCIRRKAKIDLIWGTIRIAAAIIVALACREITCAFALKYCTLTFCDWILDAFTGLWKTSCPSIRTNTSCKYYLAPFNKENNYKICAVQSTVRHPTMEGCKTIGGRD